MYKAIRMIKEKNALHQMKKMSVHPSLYLTPSLKQVEIWVDGKLDNFGFLHIWGEGMIGLLQ